MLALVLLPVVLFAILQISSVQTFIAQKAARYLSDKLKIEVEIGKLQLTNLLDLSLENVSIRDHRDSSMINARWLYVDISRINTKDRVLKVNRVMADRILLNLTKYEGDSLLNLSRLTSFFASGDTTASAGKPWVISCNYLKITHGRFLLDNRNKSGSDAGQVDFNHLDLDSLYVTVHHFLMLQDTLLARIDKLEFRERSGFAVEKFHAGVRVSPAGIMASGARIVTAHSDLDLDVAFSYNAFSDFSDFLHDVRIQSKIRPSCLDARDLSFFVPSFKGISQRLDISGSVIGPVSNLRARDLILFAGKMTTFNGDVSMSGLPDINETYINLKIKELLTSIDDLESILTSVTRNPVILPENLEPLGTIHVNGRFTGFVNDFVSYARFRTDAGSISTDLSINPLKVANDIRYEGQIVANQFNIGLITGSEELMGRMNLRASLTGQGTGKETADLVFNAVIDSLEFNGYTYDVIHLVGNYNKKIFNGTVNINDKSIGLDFSGLIDFNTRFPQFDFKAALKNVRLFDLGLVRFDSVSTLSTKIAFQLRGEHIDSLSGFISLDTLVFVTAQEQVRMDHLTLLSMREGPDYRAIELRSDFMDGYLKGKFQLEELYPSAMVMAHRYFSHIPSDTSLLSRLLREQDLAFEISVRDVSSLTRMFLPQLTVSPATAIRGEWNTTQQTFRFQTESELIGYEGMKLKKWNLEGKTVDSNLMIRLTADRFLLKEPSEKDSLSVGLDQIHLNTGVSGDHVSIYLSWNDTATLDRNKGEIMAEVFLDKFPRVEGSIESGRLVIEGNPWVLTQDNYLVIDSSLVVIDNIGVEGFSQKLLVNGIISAEPADELVVTFSEFDLDNFKQVFEQVGLSFGGIIRGELTISDVFSSPKLISKLNVKDFEFNEELLGDLIVETGWDATLQKVNAHAEIIYHGNDTSSRVLLLDGDYNPTGKGNNFDFRIRVDNLRLQPIGYFLKDVFSEMGGYAKGELQLKGRSEQPALTGELFIRRGRLMIDFLKVKYTFSDKIVFGDGYIGFDQMTVLDTLGNPAKVNGKIYHRFFRDFSLDLDIAPENMLGMNTTAADNSYFYGTARATGNVRIRGPANKLAFDIQVKTEKGTHVYLPISYTADVSENTFIQFVQSMDTLDQRKKMPEQGGGLDLTLGMDVTEAANIQIFLPMQMGNIKVNGHGLLKLAMGPTGDPTMFGTYTMNAGTFYFTLKNLISRTFQIKQGGTISWSGDMYDANINLKAVYQVKPLLSSLPTVSATDSSVFNERVPVDCVIGLTGDLFNPMIRFSLDMPDVTEEQIRTLVYNSIDTTNEAVMNQQMISLLVLNSFSFNTGSNVASSMGISSYDILTNQLNNWLSQISNEFDIGVNYQKGDASAPEQLEVALSTQLFNNRILVNGNFGVGNYKEAEKTSNIVGDVMVEYKITEDGRLRVRAYNKTNTYDLINDNAPYTQGVGVSYKKDFNRFRDIFQRKKKKQIQNETVLLQ